jgi:hypothetical protein
MGPIADVTAVSLGTRIHLTSAEQGPQSILAAT